jgi:delta(3,5)-delta(2,4)-dienoyl-CoA isomerase
VDIAAACDIRLAASSTRFSIKASPFHLLSQLFGIMLITRTQEVDVGLAADIGSLARLPKITGNESLLRELAFTARDFSAAEALQLGLVSKVIEGNREEVQKSALALAASIAAKSPIAVVGTKHVLLHARDHAVQENLNYTQTWNQAMVQSDVSDLHRLPLE